MAEDLFQFCCDCVGCTFHPLHITKENSPQKPDLQYQMLLDSNVCHLIDDHANEGAVGNPHKNVLHDFCENLVKIT